MVNTAQFEAAVMPHLPGLVRVARRLTFNLAQAEDLVQDTLLLSWRGFHQFEQGSNLRAWLYRILMNAHYGHGRKLSRVPPTKPLQASDGEHLPVAQPRTLEEIGVRQALGRLSEEHRAVLMLGVVEGLSCREMAGVLGIPMGTVMSRISRARLALREQIEARGHKADAAGVPSSRLHEV